MNTSTTPPVQQLLDLTLAFCEDCLSRRDFTTAWQALCRAVSLTPNRPDILCHRGRLALFLNDTEAAQRDFAAALKLDPRCSAAWSGLARYYMQQGDPVEAEAAADRALGFDPADEEAAQLKAEVQAHRCVKPGPSADARVKALFKPGSLVFDVGAHVGDKAAEYVACGAHVVCFEPQPECAARLRERFAGDPRVVVECVGLAARPGELELSICSAMNVISTFSAKWKQGRFANYQWDRRLRVPVTTLDAAIARHGRPAFVKVDVEGFELEVLRGLSSRVPLLSFEFTAETLDLNRDGTRHLESLGFHEFNAKLSTAENYLSDRWLSAAELFARLRGSLDPKLWGDIYARAEGAEPAASPSFLGEVQARKPWRPGPLACPMTVPGIGADQTPDSPPTITHLEWQERLKAVKVSADSIELDNSGCPDANPTTNGEYSLLRDMVRAGDIVFDVGANVGNWSQGVLDHCVGVKLHLFEPLPREYRTLVARFAKQLLAGSFVPNACALSDREEMRVLHHYEASPSWSTFHRRVSVEAQGGQAAPVPLRVLATTLDAYCEQAGVARINFLKIDVEGAELEVLSGARRLLQRGNIDCLQFEYGGTYADAGTTLREVFGFLEPFGLLFFQITPRGLVPCPEFHPGLENYQYANYLAVHPRFRAMLLGEKPCMFNLGALAKKHDLKPRGVIHLGAHEGKELETYRTMGFARVLFVEANPVVFARLQARISHQPGVTLACCAVTNTEGTARLHVTSMDQSSSLLPLKEHRTIYPGIVEQEAVEVRAITLDALLDELNLDPAEFNFLNIDIQGAELLALQGAAQTLCHIEAINTEVNFAELYEGCARIEEMDAHLERAGFRRMELTTPFHPSWGDAFYIRQPVVAMSSLGHNGRFANQVFQYGFLKTYARQHDLRVETPAWIGQQLFGHVDLPMGRPLPELREHSNSLSHALVPNAPQPFRNVDFRGFFQYHTSYYAPQRDYWRSLFQPAPEVRARVQPMLERLRAHGRTVVGLHLRRGDYGYEQFFVAPTEWYLSWLRGLWSTLDKPVLFIASDEPTKVLPDFAEFNPITSKNLGPILDAADFYPDFFLLSQCDALAISNSSFSFAAAMLNEQASIFARPHLPTQKLIPFNPWNSETIFRDAKVEPPSMLQTPVRLIPGTRFSFVTIVLNGMPFIEHALQAVYDFAHEIVIVEGAVKDCLFAANPDGSSVDGTVECIRRFPDPLQKIHLIQGQWPEKCEMQNAALEHVSGDYVWLMDSDEIYRRSDLDKVQQLLQQDSSITQINVIPDNFWKGFDYIFVSPAFYERAAHYRRIFKFIPGARFTSHRPPTMVHPGSERTTEQMKCIHGEVTRSMGIVPFHYSYVVESQVTQKIELYNRYGWGKQWKINMNEWLRECWQKWTPDNRTEIESRYPVWTGGCDSCTAPFTGEHPEVMREFIQHWRCRNSAETRSLRVIGHARYLRQAIANWSPIRLDAPLQKRLAVIKQHLAAGTPFWNNHVGLAFLATRLQPASFLEIGCRTCGSFVQVLGAASLREATAVDLWAGSYSDLPNTRDFAAAQVEHYLGVMGKTLRVELRQGNIHIELKKLNAEGRKFDLINVDGDHTDAGALEDLEDALVLLNERGAILLDDIIHPGHRSLLSAVEGFAAAHPELTCLLNTAQDNGVAILLRNVSADELLQEATPDSSTLPDKSHTHVVQPSRRLKVAGDVATKADLTQVDSQSAFALAIRKLFAEIRPTKIIETGTYLGTGTTKVIAEAIRDLKLQGAMFHSIEVNPRHLEAAKGHLETSGLSELVQLQPGLSVPRRLLPSLRQIQEQTVSAVESEDLFVDHQEHERALLYLKETDFGTVPEDLLGQCLRQFENHPDFVLLDSGGHMGHVEFKYLLSQLAGSCYIALDDIHHVKHHRSFRQMQNDPRFEIIVSSKEKFGFCIAKFTPTTIVPDLPKSILWVRTDSIGDAVLASSMLPLIRQRFPKARVSVLCQEHLSELYLTCPHIESIVCYNKQKAEEDTAYRDAIVADIRSVSPELILNSIYSRESRVEAMLQQLQGIPAIGMEGDLANITSSEREKAKSFYTALVPDRRSAGGLELEHHRDFLAGLGIQAESLQPIVWLTPDDEAAAAAVIAEHDLDPAHTIALFPGAQHEMRVYPRYVEALKELKGYRYLLLGGENDLPLCQQIAAALPGQPVNLAGRTTLRELAALIRRCRLFVGSESAGAHIACAVGVANVVLIGGGHFGRFMPYSRLTSLVCLPLECYGCNWLCRFQREHCVKDVAPAVLAEAVQQTLVAPAARPRLFVQAAPDWKPVAGWPQWLPASTWIGETAVEVIDINLEPALA